MYILGISCYYHDSSATLLKDGIIVAAAEEERFTRKKHDNAFPINAIEYCLSSQCITINKIAYIGFYEKPILKFERIIFQHLQMFPYSIKTFLSSIPSWLNHKLNVKKIIQKKLEYSGEILFINHHMAHAASTFLVSPFAQTAIVIIDGVGEWATTTYGFGQNNSITLEKQITFPHSLGLLYSTITAYLGFSVNNSEYKVMGLAAYGDMNPNTNPYYTKLLQLIDIKKDGSFHLNMTYFNFHYLDKMPSDKLCSLLGHPVYKKDSQIDSQKKDIAAALQLTTEYIITKILNHVYQTYQCDNLVLAGGVALNSVNNGKIIKNTPFKKIWIQPNASDGGTSLGVASYIYNSILNNKRAYVQTHSYLGPEFKTTEIKNFLDSNKIIYSTFKDKKEKINKTSQLLWENKVIGWFQGRMEWGPRALGNRSILANPCNPHAQTLLNQKVKHRETFRPFAPVVCREDAHTYFNCDQPIPEPTDFMLMVYPVREKWLKKLPSITHVDGSGRLQTIRKEQNAQYYNLIKTFGKFSTIPVLINTSFNIRGEPIVCSPQDAYRCMMGTEIDYLVIDKFLIKRGENQKDVWESEVDKKD